MIKAQPLEKIEGSSLSEQDLVRKELDDEQAYINLANSKNNLIAHLEEFCR